MMRQNEEACREVRRKLVAWQQAVHIHGETSRIAQQAREEFEKAGKDKNQGDRGEPIGTG